MNQRRPKRKSESRLRRREKETWIKIAENEIDWISGDLLDWSGLRALWDANNLDENHDFYHDVVKACRHVFFDAEPWDNNYPGQSGFSVTVETNDAALLKAEMRAVLKELISKR